MDPLSRSTISVQNDFGFPQDPPGSSLLRPRYNSLGLLSINRALQACRTQKLWRATLSVLAQSGQTRIDADKVHFSLAFTTTDYWYSALGLLREMSTRQIEGDMVSYGSAVRACQGSWLTAILLLKSISSIGILPNPVLCSGGIGTCKQWHSAGLILADMALGRVRPNTISYNSLLGSEQMVWALALSIMRQSRAAAILCDVISFNASISSCERTSLWQPALALVRCMNLWFIQSSIISFNAVLSACDKAAQWRSLSQWSSIGFAHGFVADEVTSGSAVRGFGQAQHWRIANKLLQHGRLAAGAAAFDFTCLPGLCCIFALTFPCCNGNALPFMNEINYKVLN